MNLNSLGARVGRYVAEQLGTSGFCILKSSHAYQLRRDLWSSWRETAMDFSGALPKFEELIVELGVRRFWIRFADAPEDRVPAIARSEDRLGERIAWLTGLDVLATEAAGLLFEAKRPTAALPATVDGEAIPNYPCQRRTELLARAGITEDPLFRRQPAGPGPSTGYNAG